MATTFSPVQPRDTRIVLLDPSRTIRAIITDHLRYKASIRLYEQSTFEITVPMTSPAWTLTYSGSSAASVEWANWSFDFYFRGTKKFSGPVVAGSIEEEGVARWGATPVAYATLVCSSWMVWLLGAHTIQTASGADWSASASPWDNIARQLVRDQATSSYVTPPGYPGSTARSNHGPFTVTVESNTSTAANGSFNIQTGKPLLETLMELCSTPPNLDTNGLWPYMTETSPGTFRFGVLVGRSGGGRQIGSDLSASVIIAGQLGSMKRARYSWDHQQLVTVACVGGTKRGANRRRSWQKDATGVFTTFGVREDEIGIANATTANEREAELRRIMNETNAETTKTWEFDPVEREGSRYVTDFNEKDTITAALRSSGKTIAQMVIGADVEATSPDPASVKLIFGSYPRDPIRDAQRSGGGGRGGGRRGGNKPKKADGDDEQPADEIMTFKTVTTQDGSAMADQVDDTLDIAGLDTATYVRVKTSATDDPENVRLEVIGDYTAVVPEAQGYVVLKDSAGVPIYLLATLVAP